MQLVLVEDKKKKKELNDKFVASLKKAWGKHKLRFISYKPTVLSKRVHHNGDFWFAYLGLATPQKTSKKAKPSRHLNYFGCYSDSGNLMVAVEANISVANGNDMAGFYAYDSRSDSYYLMHNGGIGGGRKGIGKKTFLGLTDERLVPVSTSSGGVRMGIIVTKIDSKTIGDDVARFIKSVDEFKTSVSGGKVSCRQREKAKKDYKDYEKDCKEFAGKTKCKAIEEGERTVNHGYIYRALKSWREKAELSRGEKIEKNRLIDMGVRKNGNLSELYEIKTSCGSQSMYTAIGQILVHSDENRGKCERWLVVPAEKISGNIKSVLKNENIGIIWYEMTKKTVTFFRPRGKILWKGPVER